MVTIPRTLAVIITAVCILALLPGAGAMNIQLDPLQTASGSYASVNVVAMSAASAGDNYPISVEQAKNSIRVFMGDLSAEPVLGSTGSLEIGNYYRFMVKNTSFEVNQNTGVVEFVHYGDNVPQSAVLTISRDEAYAKATAFAGKNYDGFSGKTWKLVVDETYESRTERYNQTTHQWDQVVLSRAYDFVLREEKDHVLLPSIVHVRVNPQTGSIVDYWGVDRVVTVPSLKSTTTLSDAIAKATQYSYGEFTVTSSEGYLAVVTRNQNVENLAWVIKLTGTYSYNPTDVDTYVVVVAATDGSVLAARWSSIWPESRLNYL